MQRFVKKIVDLMREEMLFSWQGGPIILLQIENEYGDVEGSYGEKGKEYVKWAAKMATGLGAGVPWVMCKQVDAPEYILDACNGYYCDGFRPNSYKKPVLWTENWDGWYTQWGGRLPHRPVEDLAFAFFGGTNFGRTSGGPNQLTSYDYDAPLDEYVAVDSPQYIKLGPMQEAHVYGKNIHRKGETFTWSGNKSRCSAFLANIDEHNEASVTFFGEVYTLPPWSVSILPDCKNTVYNTAKVGAQTSIKTTELSLPLFNKCFCTSTITKTFLIILWYMTRVYVYDDDISFWEENSVEPALTIDSMRDLVHIFINGKLIGSVFGRWVKVDQPLQLMQGYNDIVLLSETIGLQNFGAFLEKDGAGFKGQIKLTGFRNGDINLTDSLWTYQVGLKGEFLKIYNVAENETAGWTDLTLDAIPSTFSWYKTYFDAPVGMDPVALDFRSMGKGQAWVNGHHIGRYWTLVAPKDGCQSSCNYRGAYHSDKCTTNCGKPTQIWYHVPRSWLQSTNNLLVIFEETGGNPFEISIKPYSTHIICGQVSESHYPPLRMWFHPNFVKGKISASDMIPEIHFHCDDGHKISSIEFASYGTPEGSCQKFSKGNCHAPNSLSVVSQACEGRNSCSVRISNAVFGGDPCHGTVKTLAVEARCVPSSNIGVGQFGFAGEVLCGWWCRGGAHDEGDRVTKGKGWSGIEGCCRGWWWFAVVANR
ncbi:beta galactosidase 9 [Actinidia rufa]|uniref:Beta-galactosidase n=1 Tax=Actinidia rufa TaxID=165716 RepID=A0A7J0E546_9ERIC|nr:beta galactosidase 9 [Actinidia rufa]